MSDKAILYDAIRCTACRGCQVACKQWNDLPAETTKQTGTYENPSDLSFNTWIKMKFTEVDNKGKVDWLFTRQACMHCTEAGCVKVCPSHALYHHELGFVAYDKDLCTGCGYCVEFCPFKVPRYEKNTLTGISKMQKCVFCTTPGLDRIAENSQPACVKTCPPKALKFGGRDELIKEGKTRVQQLQTRGYKNAQLYGEKELGGLHVMYVLSESPEVVGLPKDPQLSPVAYAWKDIIQPLGLVVGGLTILGLGLNYIVAKKMIESEKK